MRELREPRDRLIRARERSGFQSAAQAAERFGWTYSTYAAHENGQNGISVKAAEKYSRAFKVSAAWLLTGSGKGPDDRVPVRGYLGSGFEIMALKDDENVEFIEPPLGVSEDLVAIKVRGNSMEPAYYDGDVIFYNPQKDTRNADALIGKECIVQLRDDRMFLRRIMRSPIRGRYVLYSYNTDPLVDVEILWAVPVRFIQRG